MPLKSRRVFPPGSFQYYEPKTGWSAPDGLTFEECVAAIIAHRNANPRFANQWMTDVEGVSNELDFYTCLRINGDENYCTSGDPPNFQPGLFSHTQRTNPNLRRVVSVVGNSHPAKTVAGIGLMIDWWGDSLEAAPKDLAEQRASVCARCPKNQEGDFWQRIDAAVAKKIKSVVAIKNDMKMETTFDSQLKSCMACDCWNQLKVWTKISHIKAHMSDAVKQDLHETCWILRELNQ